MSSEILQLTVGSRDLSQAEKTIAVVTSWETQKMTTFSPRTILSGFCELAQLVTTAILFSAWDKSRDPIVNWRTLDDM